MGSKQDLQVILDTSELDISLREAGPRMLRAIRRGFGETMSRVKSRTKDHINKNFRSRATQKVGLSLDSEIEIKKDTIEAIFGSKGPDFDGEIGVGIHSNPDDNKKRWNIAQMYNDGIPPRPFVWKGESGKGTAHIRGRQAGTEGGSSPWIGNKPFFYGAPRLSYIKKGQEIFKNISEQTVKRHIDREFQEVI